MHDVLAGAEHDAEYRQFGQGAADVLDVSAQFAAVERARHHRTAALRAAGCFGVVVRKGQRHVEAHGRVGGEEIDGLWPRGQESIHPRGIKAVAGLMAQIRPCLIRILDDAPGVREARARDPEPAAGARRGAAKVRLHFDDQDIEPMVPGGDRGR